jgi:hypothetical protein
MANTETLPDQGNCAPEGGSTQVSEGQVQPSTHAAGVAEVPLKEAT